MTASGCYSQKKYTGIRVFDNQLYLSFMWEDLVRKWKRVAIKSIRVTADTTNNTDTNNADDQMIVQESEDFLRLSIYTLGQHVLEYNLCMSTSTVKVMVFEGNPCTVENSCRQNGVS